MNRKTLYPAGMLSLLEVSDLDIWIPLGITLEEDGAFLVYATLDGRLEVGPCKSHRFNDLPATHLFLRMTPDGPRISWGGEGGVLESFTTNLGSIDRLEVVLQAARVWELYDVEFLRAEKDPLTSGDVFYKLFRPQPEQDPLRNGINVSGHQHQSTGESIMATANPAKRSPAKRTPAKEKEAAKSGICLASEIEGAEEAGFEKVQVWPAAKQEKGFMGFATLWTNIVVIKDIVVREAGEKSKNPGVIYGAMPAKKNAPGSEKPYSDIVYFVKDKEDAAFNRRDILDSMVDLALARAEGREPALEEAAK